jgi:hypothetical protein
VRVGQGLGDREALQALAGPALAADGVEAQVGFAQVGVGGLALLQQTQQAALLGAEGVGGLGHLGHGPQMNAVKNRVESAYGTAYRTLPIQTKQSARICVICVPISHAGVRRIPSCMQRCSCLAL